MVLNIISTHFYAKYSGDKKNIKKNNLFLIFVLDNDNFIGYIMLRKRVAKKVIGFAKY